MSIYRMVPSAATNTADFPGSWDVVQQVTIPDKLSRVFAPHVSGANSYKRKASRQVVDWKDR